MANATMRADIERQPAVLAEILPKLRAAAQQAVPKTPGGRIWAGGCGDSLFAAQAAAPYFAATGLPYRAGSALELGFQHDGPQEGDHAVLMSISGGTMRTVECARRLQARGVRVIAVTCAPGSALNQAAAASMQLDYEPMPRTTPHTTDYTVTLLALAALAEAFAGHEIPELETLPARTRIALPICFEGSRDTLLGHYDPDLRARYFFLGGLDAYGTAAYAAAKFHEAGGLPALAAESENFVHGMNFMLEQTDLVVPIVDPGPAGFRAGELARELPALAETRAILGTTEDSPEVLDRPLVDLRGEVPLHFPILSALAVQALALTVAELVCPDLEEPRAGFADGERHAAVQSRLMKQGRTVFR
ncbi:SIS domain-containing protein [Rhodovibrio salinarum]|uniref:SIS domain-containing protein n=1 Tax=Rhodovibrio salinarum TaxID=1087 RepID=A0A934QFW6_9PROT|nr:SIS domain-containing protein [Rhodovibrio salinarum]MBK1696216.1 SIS domain-containing protein [Rhodovibrio salinarum]